MRELPFDSTRKRMTSIRRSPDPLPGPPPGDGSAPVPGHGSDGGGHCLACTKGSPETVLAVATRVLDGDHVRPLTEEDRRDFLARDRELASRALRNLALAVREVDPASAADERVGSAAIKQDLILLGLVSMRDPLREEVPAAKARTRGPASASTSSPVTPHPRPSPSPGRPACARRARTHASSPVTSWGPCPMRRCSPRHWPEG